MMNAKALPRINSPCYLSNGLKFGFLFLTLSNLFEIGIHSTMFMLHTNIQFQCTNVAVTVTYFVIIWLVLNCILNETPAYSGLQSMLANFMRNHYDSLMKWYAIKLPLCNSRVSLAALQLWFSFSVFLFLQHTRWNHTQWNLISIQLENSQCKLSRSKIS